MKFLIIILIVFVLELIVLVALHSYFAVSFMNVCYIGVIFNNVLSWFIMGLNYTINVRRG